MASPKIPQVDSGTALLTCLVNWLLPGAGYILCGDWKRGLVLGLVINACFVGGLLYGGYVLMPAFSPRDPEFNVVMVLTYCSQAFYGGGWLLLQILQKLSAGSPDSFFSLQALAIKPYSDLGSFHLVVAGSLNYLATIRLYELLTGKSATPEGENPAPEAAAGGEKA